MKKNKIMLILISIFSFIFNLNAVLADDIEREVIDLTKDKTSYKLNGYTNCSVNNNALSENVSITNDSGYAVFLKLKDPVGNASDVGKTKVYNVTCTPVLNQKARVQFNLEMTLISQEEANDDSEYLDYSITIDKSTLFPEYSSCVLSGANERYIKIEKQSNGVYITVLKSDVVSKSIELDCVTLQGNDAKLHLKVAGGAVTGNDGLNGAGHENKSNNSSSTYNNSTNSNNHEWGDSSTDCSFIFGKMDDHDSFAYMLRQILRFLQFLGPILVIGLTILELVKAVASSDKDALTKLLKRTAFRMIYAVLLFVFPIVLDKVLQWTSVYGTCEIAQSVEKE